MKKILAYVTPEKHASLFDVIVAYDSGADVVVPYTEITTEDMRDIILSGVFTRHSDDLKNTAIFIGGHDVDMGEELLNSILKTFNELPDSLRVSVAIDPDGAYTTSSACLVKIKSSLKELSGLNSTILAGTGPVGQMISVLLAMEGSNVTLTSRRIERAENVCEMIKRRYNVEIKPFEAKNDETTEKAVSDSDIVITTGPEGVRILPRRIWSRFPIKVLADLSAVSPCGIEGIDANDDCREIERGKIGIGALAIGKLKMRCHHEVVKRLFEEKGIILDLERVYEIARGFDPT
ncbi:MAG TPA: methylenetetrahydrofolate dehydrogenase [Candidatus Altiarchaeales archaeon]|nr:methylenetetrahydrofolate dehydrogenase [Candidatus Altiarchaeales archaeon]